MRHLRATILFALSALSVTAIVSAQQTFTTATTTSTSVPNLIRYIGTLKDAQGVAPASTMPVGVTFAIYNQQDSGAAIWQETQNVSPDANGQYSVVLGSTTAAGLPGDLFSQQEQRWLGVQVQGEAEQARVLLVSVPYAFKAHEADTLGGLPPSAFAKVPLSDASNGTPVNALVTAGNAGSGATAGKNAAPGIPAIAGVNNGPCILGAPVGAPGYIPIWNNPVAGTNVICDSVIYQRPFGLGSFVGIGTTTPVAQLDVSGSINSSAGYEIGGSDVLVINLSLNNLTVGGGPGSINSGGFNTFSGVGAGFTNGTGNANTFSGAQAGYANANGQSNTFTGVLAGARNVTGNFNSFYGTQAGLSSKADYNTFLGVDTGFLTTTGSNNTFLGAEAGNSNIGGSYNTFSGRQAGFNSTASNGSFYGYQAGYNNAANGSSFYGNQAGFSNTTATGSTFFGYQAGFNTMTDDQTLGSPSGNAFFGYQAGFNNTSLSFPSHAGSGNTFAGYQAGYSNTTDSGNTFLGYQAGYYSNPGQFPGHFSANTFAGYQAGYSNTTGILNAYFGWTAGVGSNGQSNAFFGGDAGSFNLNGSWNTFIGGAAGESATGSANTSVGFLAGSNSNNGNNDVYIANLGPPSGNENNTIRIGGDIGIGYGSQTATYIAGIFNEPVNAANNFMVCVDNLGKLGTLNCSGVNSSRRFKEQIRDMGDSTSGLLKLRPVTFFYKPQYDDGSHRLQYGLIAEEVANVYPDMVVYDTDGQPLKVKYESFAPMLLNELQKERSVVMAQQDELQTQLQQITAQRQEIDGLKLQLQKQNASLQERLARIESYVETQLKTVSDNPPRATSGSNVGSQ